MIPRGLWSGLSRLTFIRKNVAHYDIVQFCVCSCRKVATFTLVGDGTEILNWTLQNVWLNFCLLRTSNPEFDTQWLLLRYWIRDILSIENVSVVHFLISLFSKNNMPSQHANLRWTKTVDKVSNGRVGEGGRSMAQGPRLYFKRQLLYKASLCNRLCLQTKSKLEKHVSTTVITAKY